jgi:hypothetical protein
MEMSGQLHTSAALSQKKIFLGTDLGNLEKINTCFPCQESNSRFLGSPLRVTEWLTDDADGFTALYVVPPAYCLVIY